MKAVKTFYKNTGWMMETRNVSTLLLVTKLMFMLDINSPEVSLGGLTQIDLANELGYSRETISRSFKELRQRNVIARKRDRNGVEISDTLILNPKMYWYGDLEERERAIKKYRHYFV